MPGDAPDRHLVAVWNPSYVADAMDEHRALLLGLMTAQRDGKRPADEVYVWWGRIRSGHRRTPLPHLDQVLTLGDRRDLRENLFGETALDALDPTVRGFVASAEHVFRTSRGTPGFDFSGVIVNLAKACEVQAGLVVRAGLKGAPDKERLAKVEGTVVDLGSAPGWLDSSRTCSRPRTLPQSRGAQRGGWLRGCSAATQSVARDRLLRGSGKACRGKAQVIGSNSITRFPSATLPSVLLRSAREAPLGPESAPSCPGLRNRSSDPLDVPHVRRIREGGRVAGPCHLLVYHATVR
jgi:hypothetical protein